MTYKHIAFEEEKIQEIAKKGFVLDVGGGARFTKWLQRYKKLFLEDSYKTFDFNARTNPDIVGDIHDIPLKDDSVDAVLCYSVLEHVHDPQKAINEIYRILKKEGTALFYVPSIYPYHASKGNYPDYWRFFDDSLEYMFSKWSHIELKKVGGYFKAMSFFVPFQHKLQWFLAPTSNLLDILFSTENKTTTSGYIVYAKK